MSWKFWKREEEPDYYIESRDIPASTLFRWALYDLSVKNPNKFAKAAGFNPVSEEGETMEMRDSVKRLERLLPYTGFIATMADINAQILTEVFKSYAETNDFTLFDSLDENESLALNILYYNFGISILVSSLSAALELGIIENPGTYTTGGNDEF